MPHKRKLEWIVCQICQEDFIGTNFGGGNRHKTCSRECNEQARSHCLRRRRGADNNRWSGGKRAFICQHCGVEFRAYNTDRGLRKYCSWSCSNNAKGRAVVDDMRERIRFENQLCEFLGERGYQCLRSAGSRGPIDVFACSSSFIRFIQVKTTKKLDRRGNTSVFRDAIERLQELPDPPCSYKELWVWVMRKGWIYTQVNDAPRDRSELVKYIQNIKWIEPA